MASVVIHAFINSGCYSCLFHWKRRERDHIIIFGLEISPARSLKKMLTRIRRRLFLHDVKDFNNFTFSCKKIATLAISPYPIKKITWFEGIVIDLPSSLPTKFQMLIRCLPIKKMFSSELFEAWWWNRNKCVDSKSI